jgi:hypothetical protein
MDGGLFDFFTLAPQKKWTSSSVPLQKIVQTKIAGFSQHAYIMLLNQNDEPNLYIYLLIYIYFK